MFDDPLNARVYIQYAQLMLLIKNQTGENVQGKNVKRNKTSA